MASINGISVKAVKKFRGHEQEPLAQGNLYIGSRKIAFWSQDARGRIFDNLSMEEGLSEHRLRDAIISRNRDKAETFGARNGASYTIQYDLEELMHDLLILKDTETAYKAAIKIGYSGVVQMANSYKVKWHYVKHDVIGLRDEEIKKIFQAEYDKMKSRGCRKGKEPEFRVFRSMDDFSIGEKISTDDIRVK